jgi:hypothetical protein
MYGPTGMVSMVCKKIRDVMLSCSLYKKSKMLCSGVNRRDNCSLHIPYN